MKGAIQSVELSYLVHATEDHEKLAVAAADVLGASARAEVQTLEGHFGNEIKLVKFHLTGADADAAVRRIFAKMPRALGRGLRADLGSLVDERSALFLRFDKQKLVQGELSAGSADPVRVKVKPRLFLLRGTAAGFYERLMEGGGDG